MRAHPSPSIRCSVSVSFFSPPSVSPCPTLSTDAQIKGDSGRAESQFRTKRPASFSIFFLPLWFLLSALCSAPSGIVLAVNGIGGQVLLKRAVIARHKYPREFCCLARILSLSLSLSARRFLSPREEFSRSINEDVREPGAAACGL